MSAERTPPTEPSLLAWPLGMMTRLVVRFPMAVLALGIAAALGSLVLSGARLGFRTSRLDLINAECPYNQLWIEYINEFGDDDDVVVVVEGANRAEVVPVLEDLARELRQRSRLYHAVFHEIDLSKIRPKGLYYLETEDLAAIEAFLGKVDPIVQGDWSQINLGQMVGGMSSRLQFDRFASEAERAAAEEELARLSKSLLAATTGTNPQQSPWPEMPSLIATFSGRNSEYLLQNEGRLGVVLLRLVESDDESFTQGSNAIDELRRLIKQVAKSHPQTTIGLTGLPVMENDEMRASQVSMTQASLLALVGVACLFVAGFGGLRHPLMTVAALLLALAWSLGYITLVIGHLNILSISFGAILIGLGIDFGVHYSSRYLQLRGTIRSPGEALVQTARGVGPGILTGAVTTAIAFCMAGLTDFTGVAEFGIIAGGGILLCCLAAMVILPAMIQLADSKKTHQTLPAPLDIHDWMQPAYRRPKTLLTITLAGTLALSSGMGLLWYDHNLLNLQPENLESVKLERKLLDESEESIWFALSITDSIEELLERKEQFEQLPSVERVTAITDVIPPDHREKRAVIEQIHDRLRNLPEWPPTIPLGQMNELARALTPDLAPSMTPSMTPSTAPSTAPPTASRRMAQARWNLEQVYQALCRMDESERCRWLSRYQQYMAGDLLNRLKILRGMAHPEPPQLSDLPESHVTRFVSRNGRYLLRIYAKGDIWKMAAMEQFVREVRGVDPRATGNPLQTYEASREMKRSYEQAAWYALAAVLAVLYIDFRSLRFTLLAMVPVGLGMMQLFGVLGLLNIPLNPANMIVLPLILGIGIDDGVHVIHDFRRQRGRYRMSASTASAVLITSLTTMIGFGSLMIASHRGLQSLGRVLTIGVSCCLFTSLVMLPAMLTLLSRHRRYNGEDESADGEPIGESEIPQKTYDRTPADHPGTSVQAMPEAAQHDRVLMPKK